MPVVSPHLLFLAMLLQYTKHGMASASLLAPLVQKKEPGRGAQTRSMFLHHPRREATILSAGRTSVSFSTG